MENEFESFMETEKFNFLKEHFFTFWIGETRSYREVISELAAVTSIDDLKTLLEIIELFINAEVPEQIKQRFLVSNISYDFAIDDPLLWINRILRQLKAEYEAKEILINVENSVVNTMRDKVAWLLNRHPETRNSDITLQLQFWEEFESEVFTGDAISKDDLYRLARLTTISRERARIQNQYHLFQGTERVKRNRKELENQAKELSSEDKPKHPVIIIYLDETGKTQKYLIIGGVWFLSRIAYSDFYNETIKLKTIRHFKKEFHFSQLTPANLPIYKEVVDALVKFSSVTSFKFISVENSKTYKEIQEAKEDLYFHLITEGVQQEAKTGRIALPKKLQIWIDPEEANADRLTIQNLNERLRRNFKVNYNDQLLVDRIFMESSKNDIFLQMADLFIGSINRIMNHVDGMENNQKDDFAKYFLNAVGINLDTLKSSSPSDMVVYIPL